MAQDGSAGDQPPTKRSTGDIIATLLYGVRQETDVYAVLGGGWRATCECGATRSVDDRPGGLAWLLAHECLVR